MKIIDVSIRDGGYLTGFHFKTEVLKNHFKLISQLPIDYIEIGYRNGSYKDVFTGYASKCDKSYLEWSRQYISKAKMTCMIHPKNVSKLDLLELKENCVDAVRICFDFDKPQRSFQAIEWSLNFDLEVFVNFIRVFEYKDNLKGKLSDVIRQLDKFSLNAIYIADSVGNLKPIDVQLILKEIAGLTSHALGFHSHNNLSLANANTLAAIDPADECKCEYVDASIFGIGKGRGNCILEDFLLTTKEISYAEEEHLIHLVKNWKGEDFLKKFLVNKSLPHLFMGARNLNEDSFNHILKRIEKAYEL